MTDVFVKSVEEGLKLSKRIYLGKDRAVAPPRLTMEKSPLGRSLIPSAPMMYAVIVDPAIVDNPDIPSYQPHVHGRCDPPALIPLQMNAISVEIDCYLDTAFITVTGSWRVHCVMANKSCSCRLAVPMGDQGSILGVEVDSTRRSYSTQLTAMERQTTDSDKIAKAENGGFLKPNLFTLTIPPVDGGSNLSVKVRWSQKLLYDAGQFSLVLPFCFPEYVIPAAKRISKREKIQLNVNSGAAAEVLCKDSSHPLKEVWRQAGKLYFSYEADVITWSNMDFKFSYAYMQVSSSEIFGGLLLQSSSIHDFDQREMFSFYLLPGNNKRRKVFRKQVIFLVDTSESMRGTPLESVKNALYAALAELNPDDSFNIIAFNGETYWFSSTLEPATKEKIEHANQWININFIAGGGTDISEPLHQAMKMLANSRDSIPLVFLITDGSVEDERQICDFVRNNVASRGSMAPRVSTFGIGTYCNHHFLQMLAQIGRGYFDAAFDIDSIENQMQRLFTTSSNIILSDVTIDGLKHLDALEVYPFQVPDLSSRSPVTVSGRYRGDFPDLIKVRGTLADMGNFVLDLKAQKAKDIPLDKVCVRNQIDILTAQAWFTQSKQLEEKVVNMSIQTGVLSEYTRMIILQMEGNKHAVQSVEMQEVPYRIDVHKLVDSKDCKIIMLRGLGVGFGNLLATAENAPPGFGESPSPEPAGDAFVKVACNCCSKVADCCCCMCCIQACSRINNQGGIILTQLCAALSCIACSCCCSDD